MNTNVTTHRPNAGAAALLALAVGLALGLIARPAQAQAYTFQTVDEPNASNTPDNGTVLYDINDSGQMVGVFYDSSGGLHGFADSAGSFKTLDDPAAGTGSEFGTIAFGINNGGEVVGAYRAASGYNSGFTVSASGGAFTSINVPGADNTFGAGINDSGQIVGDYLALDPAAGSNTDHGFLDNNGTFTTIDDPNAARGGDLGTALVNINDRGEIVGYYYDSSGTFRGFSYNAGLFTALDDPRAGTGVENSDYDFGTVPSGINASGQIVGSYLDSTDTYHGFLYAGGVFTTIDAPGAATGNNAGTDVEGINAGGQIVGTYEDAQGDYHGFLANPAPEPPAWTALSFGALGLSLLAFKARRRRRAA